MPACSSDVQRDPPHVACRRPPGPGSTTLLQSVSRSVSRSIPQPVPQSVVGQVAQQSARNESSDRIIIFF